MDISLASVENFLCTESQKLFNNLNKQINISNNKEINE